VDVARHRLQAQHGLAFLPQSVVFDPRLSCRQVMRFYARLRGVESRRIPQLLALVGLDENADKRTGELSGGLRQRLGLAVLLLPEAPVLLLDEPGLSLDPEWRVTMQEILRRKAAEGACVLVATHLLAEWNGVADRCLSCRDGKVLSEIDPNLLRQGSQEGYE
jgi:ABC-type multidrug transport system ATPase subunit